MENAISELVSAFTNGRLTRRQLIARLGALFAVSASGPLLAAGRSSPPQPAAAPTFEATELNHIALSVSDVARSREFYVKQLGMTVARGGRTSSFLNCGHNFVALFQRGEPGLHHYCYSVKDYDVDDARLKLNAEGLNPRVSGRRIYFEDPDGLTVQLAEDNHMP